MRDGLIRVAAATPKVQVADVTYNREQICAMIEEGKEKQASIMVFPELCLTAYTCGDLFLQRSLLLKAKEELKKIVEATAGTGMMIFVGLPIEREGKLYNAAAVIHDGRLLAFIPKMNIPNYSEFYEQRYFNPGNESAVMMDWDGDKIPVGSRILFRCAEQPELVIGAEICEDVWVPAPPSISHGLNGATLIANCSASDETTGKSVYREALVTGQSARLMCGYVYANAGSGESTQDLVFGGQNLIAENGNCIAVSDRFTTGIIYGDIDLERLESERRRMNTFQPEKDGGYMNIEFHMEPRDIALERFVDPAPFVPDNEEERVRRCEEILAIQAMGLKKRMEHTHTKSAVIGISGGLDSTLALLVAAKTFDLLGLPREQIISVTMPCFGTTDRTYNNACLLTRKLGATLREVDIKEAVLVHFHDIGQNYDDHDVTFENAQARERTQVLMDIANKCGGMVIGTGDMSELALGWATYNGDHMSMYGVNASVPKTLVRHLVHFYADTCGEEELRAVLVDVLGTPVSPELLPPEDGEIAQKTEDLVGPYELHDFFIYYILRYGYRPSKIYRLALHAFKGAYDKETILKWLKVCYRRFFTQQFKRSCLPDGPKVGSVAVSPRGDLRMPSDACSRLWLEELEELND